MKIEGRDVAAGSLCEVVEPVDMGSDGTLGMLPAVGNNSTLREISDEEREESSGRPAQRTGEVTTPAKEEWRTRTKRAMRAPRTRLRILRL